MKVGHKAIGHLLTLFHQRSLQSWSDVGLMMNQFEVKLWVNQFEVGETCIEFAINKSLADCRLNLLRNKRCCTKLLEAYSKPSQRSKMECFSKIING